jgi:hypothetical protein
MVTTAATNPSICIAKVWNVWIFILSSLYTFIAQGNLSITFIRSDLLNSKCLVIFAHLYLQIYVKCYGWQTSNSGLKLRFAYLSSEDRRINYLLAATSWKVADSIPDVIVFLL